MFGKLVTTENKMVMRVLIMIFFLLPGLLKAQTKKPVTKTITATTTSSANSLKTSITRGQAVYGKYCLTCHQPDGSGVPDLNPPLTKNKWTMGSKTVLIEQIIKGSNGKVEIDGETFRNTMPPLPTLTDQQIADVLTYVRNNFGNKASTVTPSEVKTVRAKK